MRSTMTTPTTAGGEVEISTTCCQCRESFIEKGVQASNLNFEMEMEAYIFCGDACVQAWKRENSHLMKAHGSINFIKHRSLR